MSCQALVEKYYFLKYQVEVATEDPEHTNLKQEEAKEYAAHGPMISCVHGSPVAQPIFPLGGTWMYGDKPGPVITCQGNLMNVDMSAYPGKPGMDTKRRPIAGGLLMGPSDIWVYFPDDRAYTGKLLAPNKIVWSNGSEWMQA